MLAFSANDLITKACNLCTHLFYSFPALSQSSMAQAYSESDSEGKELIQNTESFIWESWTKQRSKVEKDVINSLHVYLPNTILNMRKTNINKGSFWHQGTYHFIGCTVTTVNN